MNKLKKTISEVLYISKITAVNKKKIRILLSVFLANVNVLADILIILFFANIIVGEVTSSAVLNNVVEKLYLLPLIIFIRFINNFIQAANIINLQLNVESNLKDYLIREIYKKGNYSIADATYLINTLSGHIGYFYGALTNLINSSIQVIVYAAFLFYTNFDTIGLFILGAAVLSIPTRYLLVRGRKYMHDYWVSGQQAQKDIQRVIQNIFLIKILRTSEYEIDNFNNTIKKVVIANERNQNFGVINAALPNFVTAFTIAILLVFFGALKNLTLEFLGITLRLVQTIGVLNKSLSQLINSHVHLEKFTQLENNKVIIKEDYFSHFESNEYAVKFNNINFKYFNSEDYIFENLDLTIPKNRHTVITGPNGSGKSTLLGLISQVFYPEDGNIEISSSKIGYVGVTPLILEDTLRENFLYGNSKNIDDDELIALASEFELFVENEINLDKAISNRSLSAGQMQKISFIRALLAEVEILLLDESTSNLDVDTKQFIFNILNNKNITIINSTHNHEDFSYDHHIRIVYSGEKRKLVFN